jgi:uncharacterized protein (DUF169 family)
MTLSQEDLGVLGRLGMETSPVGVKYLARPPATIGALDRKMALCEMLRRAQGGDVFYAAVESHACEAGAYVLGQRGNEGPFVSGEFGAGLGVFRDERAAARLYHYIPRIAPGVAHYAAFSPVDRLPFDPDVLVLLADLRQTEILLRASSYETGRMWSSRYSAAIGCAWLLVYPYLQGEINFFPTGFGFGMRRRKLFPEGLYFFCIPFDQLPSMLRTLREMPWVPEPFRPHGLEYVRQLRVRLGLDT